MTLSKASTLAVGAILHFLCCLLEEGRGLLLERIVGELVLQQQVRCKRE
jgi:hypothetical protein